MYPRLIVDLKKISHNARFISSKCRERGISIAGVTKMCCGEPIIAETLINNGISFIADSRVDNLKKLKAVAAEKWLIRVPMAFEIEDVVQYADLSLNSEIMTVRELNKAAEKYGKEHKVVVMADLGDLREGFFDSSALYNAVDKIVNMKNIKLSGIGTNLTCYGAVIPTVEKMNQLIEIAEKIKNKYGIALEIISGGNSSSLTLALNNTMPQGINNLRLGYSIFFGIEASHYTRIEGTYFDTFIIEAQINEIKEKPSMPIGDTGIDAFLQKPQFIDRGIRRRALCGIGKQDVDFSDLKPLDEKIEILGGSSDYLIVDVTDAEKDYQVGDIVSFTADYVSALRAMTSGYVNKVYLKD